MLAVSAPVAAGLPSPGASGSSSAGVGVVLVVLLTVVVVLLALPPAASLVAFLPPRSFLLFCMSWGLEEVQCRQPAGERGGLEAGAVTPVSSGCSLFACPRMDGRTWMSCAIFLA